MIDHMRKNMVNKLLKYKNNDSVHLKFENLNKKYEEILNNSK